MRLQEDSKRFQEDTEIPKGCKRFQEVPMRYKVIPRGFQEVPRKYLYFQKIPRGFKEITCYKRTTVSV